MRDASIVLYHETSFRPGAVDPKPGLTWRRGRGESNAHLQNVVILCALSNSDLFRDGQRVR